MFHTLNNIYRGLRRILVKNFFVYIDEYPLDIVNISGSEVYANVALLYIVMGLKTQIFL